MTVAADRPSSQFAATLEALNLIKPAANWTPTANNNETLQRKNYYVIQS
jgi:hypothetical protein